jgi:hypothetical protein
MAVLLSGDFHGNAVGELAILTKKHLLTKLSLQTYQSITYHIILGDGGFLWPGNGKADVKSYRVFSVRHFPVLSVIGNHEPMLGMKLPEEDIGIGETVYLVNKKPLIAYLKRGKVYRIDGFKFLVLGGALSIDKARRVPGRSWWENEYWSDQERVDLARLLDQDNTFDYVLSHTGPNRVNNRLFSAFFADSPKFEDEVAIMNDGVDLAVSCKGWFCGHWHQDAVYTDEKMKRSYQYLYKDVELLEPLNMPLVNTAISK